MQIKKMNPHTSNVIRNLNGSYVKKSEDLIYPVERNIGNASSNECNNDDDDCLNSKEIEYDQCRSSADRESVVKDSIDNIPKIPSESNINQSHCENVNRTDVVRVKSNSNKLNFSVDRLLNKCDISEKTEIKNAICVKRCPSEILTVDKLLSLPVSRVNELEKCNKTIIRPMPVRYMQPSTTIPGKLKKKKKPFVEIDLRILSSNQSGRLNICNVCISVLPIEFKKTHICIELLELANGTLMLLHTIQKQR